MDRGYEFKNSFYFWTFIVSFSVAFGITLGLGITEPSWHLNFDTVKNLGIVLVFCLLAMFIFRPKILSKSEAERSIEERKTGKIFDKAIEK